MIKKIRIAFIIDWIPSNRAGTERQLLYLISGLNPSIFDINLICLKNTEWLKANSKELPCNTHVIEIYKLKKPSTYLNILKLTSLIRRIDPDVVHTFFPISNVVGVIASRVSGVKCIISSRRDYGQWITQALLLITKIANKFVAKITTNSENVRLFTSEQELIELEKIDVLYNGIDLKEFQYDRKDNSKIGTSLNIPEGSRVVGIVANLRPMKHLQTFVQAAFEVLKVRDDVHFLLVGRGPSEQNLKNLVEKLGISQSVHFVGSQKDVVPFLRLFDIGVNCSAQEGLSNAIIEYMATGVPCIVSGAGGNGELIEDEKNGLVFCLDNYEELSTKILRLLDDKELRMQFVGRSKEKVNKFFSLDKMISAYEGYYIKLVNMWKLKSS